MKGKVCLFCVLMVLFTFGSFAVAGALPEPSITIFPNALSPNSSFVMIVDPMTTLAPIRMGWAVYNPNMDGNYIMGQLPKDNGKGVCYFSNTDGNATCGPTPFMGTGKMEIDIFVTATNSQGFQEYINGSRIVELGDIIINGGPYLDENVKNKVLLTYYMTQSQADVITYSVYDKDMKTVSGLDNRAAIFNTTPTPGFYAGLSLPPGIYFISSVAQKGQDYGGKMDRIVVPAIDLLTLSCCANSFYFGEMVNFTGFTADDSVEIKVYYPNGTLLKARTVNIFGEEFEYSFLADPSWPEGDYNITAETDNLLRYKTISMSQLVKATPSKIAKIISSGSDVSEAISLKNKGNNVAIVEYSAYGGVDETDVALDKTEIDPDDTATLSFNMKSVSSDVTGYILVKSGDKETKIPVEIKISGSQTGCPPCPPAQIEGCGKFSLSPVSWSSNYIVDEEAAVSLAISNDDNKTINGFSYEFIPDYSSENEDMSYSSTSPSFNSLSIDSGDSETVVFSFTPDYTGTYTGKLKISSSAGSAYIIVNLEVFNDVTEEIETEKENIKLYEDELAYEVYNELEKYVSNAESKVSLGDMEGARTELEKAKAVRSLLSNYGSSLGGSGSDCPPCNCASGGGDMTMIIVIVVIVIVVLGGVGAVLYLRGKSGGGNPPEEASEEGYTDEGFDEYE
ncbi:MAG: hypothetical protein JW716_01960 [Candidatus Aenigmarchaeota archaeon]|nr:hypothetical protein [Candidatus Aenigmarchaeota archaeon]